MKKPPPTISGKAFREPGIWETIREVLLGARRPLDCIQVEVTSRCPGLCIYCPHTTMGDRWRSRDMDMETFALFWPLMRRSARVHLQCWGEPLLNPAFCEIRSPWLSGPDSRRRLYSSGPAPGPGHSPRSRTAH